MGASLKPRVQTSASTISFVVSKRTPTGDCIPNGKLQVKGFLLKSLAVVEERATSTLAVAAMSESTEIAKGEAAGQAGSASEAVAPPPSSCRKKKSEVDEGFVKDIITHIDEFVNASYDDHKTCLQKTVRKLFGMNKAAGTSAPSPPPVVSVLPLRVDTSTGKQNV